MRGFAGLEPSAGALILPAPIPFFSNQQQLPVVLNEAERGYLRGTQFDQSVIFNI